MEKTNTIRALVVDDDPDIQDIIGLCIELNWPGSSIARESDGEAGLLAFKAQGADVILLDLGLPDIDGLEVCARIRRESTVPIIMVTARGQEKDVIRGLDAGADDYIVKPFSRGELLARLNAVLRRSGALSGAEEDSFGPVTIDFENKEVRLNGSPVRLTAREYLLFERMARSVGSTVASKELLALGWGREYIDAESQLERSLRSIESKLGGAGNARFEEIRGIGYRLVTSN